MDKSFEIRKAYNSVCGLGDNDRFDVASLTKCILCILQFYFHKIFTKTFALLLFSIHIFALHFFPPLPPWLAFKCILVYSTNILFKNSSPTFLLFTSLHYIFFTSLSKVYTQDTPFPRSFPLSVLFISKNTFVIFLFFLKLL